MLLDHKYLPASQDTYRVHGMYCNVCHNVPKPSVYHYLPFLFLNAPFFSSLVLRSLLSPLTTHNSLLSLFFFIYVQFHSSSFLLHMIGHLLSPHAAFQENSVAELIML